MNTIAPLFTVATISFNSGKWIRQTIESVLASSYTNFEFLISDDCSNDDTWEIIKEYNDLRVKAWRNDKNIGEYSNRNKVLNAAAGQYILFVDGDDVLYNNTLRNISEYVQEFPEAVSIWGVWSHQMNFCIFPVLLQPEETLNWIYGANLPIAIMGFGETVFRVEALRETGGFSEEFICGDTYIKKKLALLGPILLVPIGFMFWRRTPGQASGRLANGLNGYINNVLIDRSVFKEKYFETHPEKLGLYTHNSKVRDIKILFSHTFLKGKFRAGIHLFKRLHFSYKDLIYLLKKPALSYNEVLEKTVFQGRQSFKL